MKWNKTWKYIKTVRNFVFGYIEDNVKKEIFFLSTLTSNHKTPKLTQWAFLNMQIGSRCAMGALGSWWNTRICMEMNIRALNL